MKIEIKLTVNIEPGDRSDLTGHIDMDIVDLLRVCLEDNLDIEEYEYDHDTIETEVSRA